MEKQEFFAMYGIYFGQHYWAYDKALTLAQTNWDFYEKHEFSEESLKLVKDSLGIIKKYYPVHGQIVPDRHR